MKYLLDTHEYLWWLNDDKKLKASAERVMTDINNTIIVSVVNFWEISIKLRTGKLPLKTSFYSLYENLQFQLIPITIEHVLMLNTLPLHHNDPFDRMLIAQAMIEQCTIITNDEKIKKYDIATIG